MAVISYNSADGKVIPSWADAAGTLKALQDGAVADCRPDGVTYLKVAINIKADGLDKINKPIINFTSFIKLLVEVKTSQIRVVQQEL